LTRSDVIGSLQHDDVNVPIEQMHCRRKANRASSYHDDRQVERRHQQQPFLLGEGSCDAQPQPEPPVAFTSASSAQQAPESFGAAPPQQPVVSLWLSVVVSSRFCSLELVISMESMEPREGR